MTTATSTWSNETGFWTVTDEYGNVWDVVTTSDQSMLLVREDDQRFYGCTYTNGTLGDYADDGDTAEGFDCNDNYTFHQSSGWTGEQE